MLSKRQIKIIEYIIKHPQGINATQICSELQVSSRTVRNDIASINIYLMNNHCMINSSKKTGYFIVSENVERVKECLHLMEAIDHKQIASTPMERKYYVLGKLMLEGKIRIYEAADELFVSEPTVYKDMNALLKFLLDKYHYEGIIMENSEIRMIQEEEAIRSLFYRIVKEEVYLSNKLMDIHLYQLVKDVVDLEELNDIVEYLSGYCNCNGINIPDQILYIISWMVFFTSVRVEKGHRLPVGNITSKDTRVSKMMDKLTHDLKLDFLEDDCNLLLNYIETLGLFSKHPQDSDELHEDIIRDFIKQMKDKYDLDYDSMPSLLENFQVHLGFAIKRLLMDYQLVNPLLQEVKTKYSFAYEIAMLIVPIVHKKYKKYLLEDEISFLALYIQPFLQVQNTSVQAIVVYETTLGFVHLIENWLTQEFKGRIVLNGFLPVYKLEETIKNQNVDLIISTTVLEKQLDVPVINIFQLPNDHDRNQIEKFISHQAMLSQSDHIFHEIFDKNRVIFIDDECEYEEILERCTNKLAQDEKIENAHRFMKDILKREEVYPTYIDHGCYMPHPLTNTAKSSAISIAVVRNTLEYKAKPVKLLFVTALEPKIDPDLRLVYKLINTIATTSSFVSMLTESENQQEFIDYLQHVIQVM